MIGAAIARMATESGGQFLTVATFWWLNLAQRNFAWVDDVVRRYRRPAR